MPDLSTVLPCLFFYFSFCKAKKTKRRRFSLHGASLFDLCPRPHRNENNTNYRFWQQHNQPIETGHLPEQKIELFLYLKEAIYNMSTSQKDLRY